MYLAFIITNSKAMMKRQSYEILSGYTPFAGVPVVGRSLVIALSNVQALL